MTDTDMPESDTASSRLVTKIAEFNQYPVRYIHATWFKQLEYAQWVIALQEREQSHYHLSNYLLQSFELNNAFDYEFQSAEKRIALSSGGELVTLSLYIGIILNESVIRGVIRRQERRVLEDCLGEQAYLFAVKKAQFLTRRTDTSTPGFLIDWQHIERFKSFLTMTGLQVLAAVYEDMPWAFKKRLVLKFPMSWQKYLLASSGVFTREQAQNLLIKSYKEVNREWRHLLS